MTKRETKINELKEEIEITKLNLQILKKAKKKCTCEEEHTAHYHELLAYDSVSGDIYLETTSEGHSEFIALLRKNLIQLENRLAKLSLSNKPYKKSGEIRNVYDGTQPILSATIL